jgi:transcriptional regulator with XRE-family HTH domain
MAHAYRRFVQHEMDKRIWTQADLARAAGLSNSLVSRIVTDDQERLTKLPMTETIDGLVKAFGDTENTRTRLLLSIAEAMGFPVGEVAVADASLLADDELLAEVARRMQVAQKMRDADVSAVESKLALVRRIKGAPAEPPVVAEAAMEERRPGEVQLPPPGQSEEPET